MRRCSPSSSEGALTSLRPDLPLGRQDGGAPSLDKFLDQIGHRYQIIIMFLLSANSIPIVVNHLLMAFYAVSTPHNCRPPDNATRSLWLPLETTPPPFQADKEIHGPSNHSLLPPATTLNPVDSNPQYSQCHMYIDGQNHSMGQQSCINGYEFHFEHGNEWNVIAEWGLVCNRQYVAPLITTVYFCGVMLGGIIFGSLSDRYGRKYMMLVCLYTQCLIGVGLHFVRRLVVFIGLRFIQGIFIQGLQCVTYSMVMELFAPQYRALAGCVIEAFWATGVITLALIAKYVQHWRYIQLAINIPTIATLFYIWIIPESVRWLLSRGKLNRAEKIVKRIASCNGIKLDPICLRVELEDVGRNLLLQNPTGKRPDIREIVRQSGIRKHAFAMFFIWFSVSLSYYGISYTIPNLSGDRYLNFIIGGGIELAAYMLAFVVLNGFGRKYPLMIYLLLSGLLCISVVSVRTFVPDDWVDVDSLAIGLALVGKAAVVSCFCTIFIYSNEIFPTVIRTVGVGACAFFGRVGSLLAPQLLLAGEYLYSDSPQLVTFLTFGALSIVAAILTLLLPETLDRDLPDTVQDANYMNNRANSRERTSSMVGDDTTTMSGMEVMASKGNGSDHGGQNTLLRMKGGTLTRIHSPIIEETNYGKSPEWVEVDGLIVSKSHLTPSHLLGSANGTLSRSTMNNTMDRQPPKFDHLQTLNSNIKVGSVTSLPYCSQTLISSNYNSSTLDGSNSTTTTHEEIHHGTVKRKSSNDSSGRTVRQGSNFKSYEQNANNKILLQQQQHGGSKTLPNKNANGKTRTKVKHSKPSTPSYVYQTNSSRSTISGSSSCCSRSSSDCCSCHTDCPRDDIHNRYQAPPVPRKITSKQIPPPPPTNPPPPLSHHTNQLFLDRKRSFELLQDIGGESQSERESENQYETIPSSSLPVLESDFEETDTDVQTIDVDSYEESGNDSRCGNSHINQREINRILKQNNNIHDALKPSYYNHRKSYGISEEGPQTLESSLEPDESQDTSVISAQHSGVYDISGNIKENNNKFQNQRQKNNSRFDYRNNNEPSLSMNNGRSRNNNNDMENTINDKAKLQGYIFRKRLLMTEANETVL